MKLDEIARLAGVSRTTASYVINGKAKQYRVSDKTVEKVMAVELAALKGEKTFPEYTVDSIVLDNVDLPQPEKTSEPEHKVEKRKKKHRN